MNTIFKWQPSLMVIGLLLFLSGCTVQLAPSYDKAVVEELSHLNKEIMTIFAAVSSGSKPDTFQNREERYNTIIGELDALAIQAGARPIPKNSATIEVNKLLQSRGIQPLGDEATLPSVTAIKKVSETITKMRDTDKKQGVTPIEAKAFKGQASIFLDQAITYENFLQR